MPNRTWYEANMSGDQGLVIEEGTGRSVAVTYDKEDTALAAAAPDLLQFALAFEKVITEAGHNLLSTASTATRLHFISDILNAWNNNYQAIAKAKGE